MNLQKIEREYKEANEKSFSFAAKGGDGKYHFQTCALRNMDPGVYRGRFVWADPAKNPDGTVMVATSAITQADKTTTRFLTYGSDSIKPDEVYPGLESTLKHIDETGLYEKLEKMGDKTKALRDAIKALTPWRRYWVPVFIHALEVPVAGTKYTKLTPSYDPNSPWLDKVLEMNESLKIVQALFSQIRAYPDLDDPVRGRNFTITVAKNRYTLAMDEEPSALDPKYVRHASDHYPDLITLARKFYLKDPAEVVASIKAQWWAKSLEQAKVFFPDYVSADLSGLADEEQYTPDPDPEPELGVEEEYEPAWVEPARPTLPAPTPPRLPPRR